MLAWFRRHAKILMVVLGSSAMAIFGLGPVFDTLASRGREDNSRQEEVIATWNGGDITRVDLDLMEMRHYQALRFLDGVRQAAEKKKGDVVNSLAIPISPIQDGRREMVDDQLITRYLMSERALEEGMVVSDGMVNDYILMLSGDAGFSERDLEEINNTVNNRYCSLNAVRERLKTEILANQMQLCCMTAVPIVPNPIESMELYSRTMEQIECEVLPIDVEKYISKVDGEPSATEVKKLYEEGKYEFPDPTGERPGFKIGRKVNLQYLVADYETFLQNEMNNLSDQDVQVEYERLVKEQNELVLEPLPIDDGSIQINEPPPGDGEVTPPPTTGDETKAGEADKKDDAADSKAAPDDVTPPPTAGDKKESPAAETTDEGKTEKGAADKSKTDEGNTEASKSEGDKSEEGNGDQSINVRGSKFQFVSTSVQENEAKPEETKSEPVEPAKENQEATEDTSKKPDPADGDAAPKTEPSPENKSEGEAVAKQDEKTPGDIEALLKDAAKQDDKPAEKVKRTPKPLKDVVEDVKRQMSEEAANKAMEQALTQAEVMVQVHFEKRMRWEYDNSSKKDEEPAPLDHEALAKKYKLVAKETGLVDDMEIADDPIGQVRVFMNMMMQGRQVPQLVPVGQLVFNDFSDLRLYDPKQVNDNWGTKSRYLFWAVKKADTRMPELEEAEAEIKKFWKSKKALDLAMAEAESIKEKVNAGGGKAMSDLYAERVFKTGAFTWFSSFGSTRYSTPIGVTSAGENFMKTAFSLEKLKAGVAANEPKSTVYVIQATSESKGVEEAGSEYLEEQFFKFRRIPNEVQRVSQLYFQEFNLEWNQEFQDTMGLKFMDR